MLSPPPISLNTSSFSLFFAILWLTSFFLNRKRTAKFPVGPEPWPIVGNIMIVPQLLRDPITEFTKLAKKFGGVCMIWLGTRPILLINTTKDAKALMDKQGAVYSDRPEMNVFMKRVWPGLLTTMPLGEEFRQSRRIIQDLLNAKQADTIRTYQDYETKMLLRDLSALPEEHALHIRRFALSSVLSAVYGVRIPTIEHPSIMKLANVWNEIATYFMPGSLLIDYFPILQRLPERFQPWLKAADTLRARESSFHRTFYTTAKKQIEVGIESNKGFISELVKYQQREGFDEENAIGILGTIILGATDTTSTLVFAFLKIMVMNPHVVQAAQEELDRVVGPHRLPTWEDAPNLPYVRAVIKETHRWWPLVGVGVPHATADISTYQGQTVPKGTIVFPNLVQLHRDPERYGDPNVFRPERFLGDDRHASASAKHADFRVRDHCHYGFGRRLCPGIYVAENSLFISISRLLWAFDIADIPGSPPLNLADVVEGEMIRRPKPFPMRIAPRSDAVSKVIEESVRTARTEIVHIDDFEHME